jgi:predicted nucleic acid-binding protein
MFLLDTNVISELGRPSGKADPRVGAWSASTPQAVLHLSVITILENRDGHSRRRTPERSCAGHTVAGVDGACPAVVRRPSPPVDIDVALRCARLHVPDRRPERDALIAATALTHDLTVVTRNVAHFGPMGVAVLNPWDASPSP